MTDSEALVDYRLKQATETLKDAENMLKNGLTPRSVINRAYYSLFYSVLGLFIHDGVSVNTSKHSGVISLFRQGIRSYGKNR